MPPKKEPKGEWDGAKFVELRDKYFASAPKHPRDEVPSDDNEDDLFDKEDEGKSNVRDVYRQMYRDVVLRDKKAYQGRRTWGEPRKSLTYSITNPKCQGADFAAKFKSKLSPTIKWDLDKTVTARQRPSITAHLHYTGTMLAGEADLGEELVKMGTIKCILVKAAALSNAHLKLSDVLKEYSKDLGSVGDFYEKLAPEEQEEGEKYIPPWNRRSNKKGFVNHVGSGDDMTSGAILYVQSITVEKAFEGTGVGLYMLHQAHQGINSSMSLTVIKISPTTSNIDDGEMRGSRPKAAKQTKTDEREKVGEEDADTSAKNNHNDANEKEEGTQPTALVAEDPGLRKLTALAKYYRLLDFKLVGDPTGHGDLYVAHSNGNVSPDIKEVVPHFCASR